MLQRLDKSPPANLVDFPPHIIDQRASGIIITTGNDIPRRVVSEIIQVVGTEAALGLNIFKDIANDFRDFFGGRSKTMQAALKDARAACITEIKREALILKADAVVSLRFDFSEMSTRSCGGILFVAATGTAVKLEG
ncbi:uncharacterized protein YbjQ (UPF0145 family) [Rhizobium sp. BK313]|uniref:YbjQ family protein n=1 Tax=Rhizobium sp. BK313 TaxID=2587081 RepID=UPI0010DCAF17|nr:heavy metal-binding domain-containing protein [Rhizobium sp. BK313]MBB3457785.1 uncharacterized protein YbjQ (UPF0145 family) [Rhizobium sp. BK313]